MTTLYKILDTTGHACHGGTGKWHLPTLKPDGTWKPGRWMPKVENPVACARGYHLFEAKDVLEWIGATCYVAEHRGAVDTAPSKVAVEQARLLYPVPNWNDRNLRLYACRVAEDVLPIFTRARPNDARPAKAIEVARRYADGDATDEEFAAAGLSGREFVASGAQGRRSLEIVRGAYLSMKRGRPEQFPVQEQKEMP